MYQWRIFAPRVTTKKASHQADCQPKPLILMGRACTGPKNTARKCRTSAVWTGRPYFGHASLCGSRLLVCSVLSYAQESSGRIAQLCDRFGLYVMSMQLERLGQLTWCRFATGRCGMCWRWCDFCCGCIEWEAMQKCSIAVRSSGLGCEAH